MRASPMNRRFQPFIACAMMALLATGCKDQKSSSAPAASVSSPNSSSAQPTDEWLGKWVGPEGTFLLLAGGGGKYEVTIQNLDGPQTFKGFASGDQITFERHGVKEHLRATNGVETGMKWLGEKSNCLTVRVGEGYCRDQRK